MNVSIFNETYLSFMFFCLFVRSLFFVVVVTVAVVFYQVHLRLFSNMCNVYILIKFFFNAG